MGQINQPKVMADKPNFVASTVLLHKHQLALSAAHADSRAVLSQPGNMEKLMEKIGSIFEPLKATNSLHRSEALLPFNTRCTDASTAFLKVMNTTGRVVDGASTSAGAGTRRRLSAELASVSAGFNGSWTSTLEEVWGRLDAKLNVSATNASASPDFDTSVRELASALANACRSASWASDALTVGMLTEAEDEFEEGSKLLTALQTEAVLVATATWQRKAGEAAAAREKQRVADEVAAAAAASIAADADAAANKAAADEAAAKSKAEEGAAAKVASEATSGENPKADAEDGAGESMDGAPGAGAEPQLVGGEETSLADEATESIARRRLFALGAVVVLSGGFLGLKLRGRRKRRYGQPASAEEAVFGYSDDAGDGLDDTPTYTFKEV